MLFYMISTLIILYKANAFSLFHANCQPMNYEVNAMRLSWPSYEHQGEIICHIELRGSATPLCCCYISWQGQSAVGNIARGPHGIITGSVISLKDCTIIRSDYQPGRNWTYSIPGTTNPNGQVTAPGTQNASKNGKSEQLIAVTNGDSSRINVNSKWNLFHRGNISWIYTVFNALLLSLILNVIRM
uniref:Uncharacterized protein n=1 Tax=Ascaris lumbricoides TaxID=6252 RepID=A0A0M3HYM8_ASCLU